MQYAKEYFSLFTDKESGSSHSRSNNTVVEADVTAPHRNGSQLHSQGHVITSHGHQHTRTVVQTVDGDESSSSSTSTTSSSDSDSVDPQMAMVSRPPFHPSMMGLQPHHMYHNPMAMQPMGFGPCGHPGMMGSIDYPPGFGAFGGRQFGGGPIPYGGVSGGGVGPPRCFPYDDEALDERVRKFLKFNKNVKISF